MLSQLEKTRQQVAGKHQAVDAWLEARRTLLIGYMQLAGIGTARTTLPSCQQVHGFCQQLLDYICAGHFYTTDKNKRNTPDKFEFKKYDPVVRKHVIYKEAKIK